MSPDDFKKKVQHQMRDSVKSLHSKLNEIDFDTKENLDKFLKGSEKFTGRDLKELKGLAKSALANWKKVLPTAIALGLAGYFVKGLKSKAKKAVPKKAKKKATPAKSKKKKK